MMLTAPGGEAAAVGKGDLGEILNVSGGGAALVAGVVGGWERAGREES